MNKIKPDFLYHGSQYCFEVLKPQKAIGKNDIESQYAIYACSYFDYVIPFALPIRWYPDNPTGKRDFTCDNGKTKLEYGSINPNGIGYVYKVNSKYFERIDEWQWISSKEILPIEITKILVKNYWNTITFSVEAEQINNLLYHTE